MIVLLTPKQVNDLIVSFSLRLPTSTGKISIFSGWVPSSILKEISWLVEPIGLTMNGKFFASEFPLLDIFISKLLMLMFPLFEISRVSYVLPGIRLASNSTDLHISSMGCPDFSICSLMKPRAHRKIRIAKIKTNIIKRTLAMTGDSPFFLFPLIGIKGSFNL